MTANPGDSAAQAVKTNWSKNAITVLVVRGDLAIIGQAAGAGLHDAPVGPGYGRTGWRGGPVGEGSVGK